MRDFIRGLSDRAEFAVVILGAFGFPSLTVLLALLRGEPSAAEDSSRYFTELHLQSVVLYELPVLALLAAFLRVRGWSFADLGLRPRLRDIFIGLLLAVIEVVATTALAVGLWGISAGGENLSDSLALQRLSLGTVFAVAVVNPIFEETFVSGYVIAALKGRTTVWTAIYLSVAIRLLYHLYQGAAAFVLIIPFGLVLAAYYARYRRLWPLIVAHSLDNLISFLPAVQ